MNDLTNPPTRTGKIARLDNATREELNRRMADGEASVHLVDWLNGIPWVRAGLLRDFGGRPVNEQNLSAWRQGGFVDWQRHQEARAWLRTVVAEEEDLHQATGEVEIGERMVTLTLVALGQLLRERPAGETPADRQKLVFGVAQQVARLRNAEAAIDRNTFAREKLEQEKEQLKNNGDGWKPLLKPEERLAKMREIFGISDPADPPPTSQPVAAITPPPTAPAPEEDDEEDDDADGDYVEEEPSQIKADQGRPRPRWRASRRRTWRLRRGRRARAQARPSGRDAREEG